MNKNQILAGVLMASEEDIPAIVATAINQWMSLGLGVQQLLERTIEAMEASGDNDLADEVRAHLEDWA